MSEPSENRWIGKSTEDVLAESYHELRDPIALVAGYLNVLKAANYLSLTPEEIQRHLESLSICVLHVQTILDSVYQYMNEKRGNL
jgi:hypothetical protein